MARSVKLSNIITTKPKLRHKLDVQGRRMACAYTKDDKSVWITFLKRKRIEYLEKSHHFRLHTAPSLNQNAANLDLDDIDYSTVSKAIGKSVTKHDFEDRAFQAWTNICGFELKTRREIERTTHMCRTVYRKEYHCDSSQSSSDHVSDDDEGCRDIMEQESKKPWTEMTAEEAIELQRRYHSTDDIDAMIDRERFCLSIRKYGRITKDSLAEGCVEEDYLGDDEGEPFFHDEEEAFFDAEECFTDDDEGWSFDDTQKHFQAGEGSISEEPIGLDYIKYNGLGNSENVQGCDADSPTDEDMQSSASIHANSSSTTSDEEVSSDTNQANAMHGNDSELGIKRNEYYGFLYDSDSQEGSSDQYGIMETDSVFF
ncbi:hypothetical protein BKA66DRAFT_592809 [Pyrenochaeta sp. MPI-SDFR-AT-0127]|nr:hypothetical protein BKA66DRAFT_592809 [Pyrenochaeta sp. MPI-SDFR-AT-0127]